MNPAYTQIDGTPMTLPETPSLTFSTREVCNLTGATERRLHYWRALGLIPGMIPFGPGQGAQLRWSAEQVDFVRRLLLVLPSNHERQIRKAAQAVERGVCPTCEQALPQ